MRLNSGILMGWGVKCYNFVTILLLFYSFIRYIYTLAYRAGWWVLTHPVTLFVICSLAYSACGWVAQASCSWFDGAGLGLDWVGFGLDAAGFGCRRA